MANRRVSSTGKPLVAKIIYLEDHQFEHANKQPGGAAAYFRRLVEIDMKGCDESALKDIEKEEIELERRLKFVRERKGEFVAKTEAKKKSLSDRGIVKEKCLSELYKIFSGACRYDIAKLEKTLKIWVGDYNAQFKDLEVEPFTEEELMTPLLERKAIEEKQYKEKQLEARQNRLKDQMWRLKFLKDTVCLFKNGNPVPVDKVLEEAEFQGFSADLAKSDLLLLKTQGDVIEVEGGLLEAKK